MGKYLLAFLLVSFFQFSLAQKTGTLKGTVTDANEHTTISFTSFFDLTHKTGLGLSNLSGNFSFDLLPGDYTIVCSFVGYSNDTFTVHIDAGSITVNDVVLKQKQELINEVVISAGKYDENLSEVTQSMEILTPKTIENRNATDVSQALDQVPGLNILDQDPQIRGGRRLFFWCGHKSGCAY